MYIFSKINRAVYNANVLAQRCEIQLPFLNSLRDMAASIYY